MSDFVPPAAKPPAAEPALPTLPVVVVGAGPAGLAVTAELARRGVEVVVLEAGRQPGTAWRRHAPWLRLHTTRRDSSLPGLPMPEGEEYPGRDEYADYLRRYAEGLDADLRFGRPVGSVSPLPSGGWRIEIGDGGAAGGAEALRARHLVLAVGFNRRPVRPGLPGEEDFGGPVAHASRWRRVVRQLGGEIPAASRAAGAAASPSGSLRGHPRGLAGRRVLVAGLGNSGADLVAALAAGGAEVAVSVRGPVHLVPLELAGVNWRTWYRLVPGALFALGRLGGTRGRRWAARGAAAFWCRVAGHAFGDLEERGLALQRPDELVAHWRAARPPLTGGPFVGLLRRGELAVLPELVGLAPGRACLAGGADYRCDAVLLATGYRPALEDLVPAELLTPSGGAAPLVDPLPEAPPGLWLCGFPPELVRIRRRARRIARSIAADVGG